MRPQGLSTNSLGRCNSHRDGCHASDGTEEYMKFGALSAPSTRGRAAQETPPVCLLPVPHGHSRFVATSSQEHLAARYRHPAGGA